MTKAVYTSPVKALSNQKYRDFVNKFGDGKSFLLYNINRNLLFLSWYPYGRRFLESKRLMSNRYN